MLHFIGLCARVVLLRWLTELSGNNADAAASQFPPAFWLSKSAGRTCNDMETANSCVNQNGLPAVFPPSIIVYNFFGASFLLIMLYVRACTWSSPSPNSTKQNFGVGAAGVLSLLYSLGMLLTYPFVCVFFIFRAMDHDMKAQEFACQIAGWQAGRLIGTSFMLVISTLILLFNSLRLRTRFHFTALAAPYLHPVMCEDPKANARRPVLVVVGAYRGTWVGPLEAAFKDACAQRALEAEVAALDAYGTDLCPESDAWMQHNMAVEGSRVRIGWTNYATLPFFDSSVDVLVVPLGGKLAYFNHSRESDKTKAGKRARFLQECMRVLRPGGRVLSSNWITDGKAWATAQEQVGFQVSTLPKWVWFSFIPSQVVVAVKPAGGVLALPGTQLEDPLVLAPPGTVDVSMFDTFPPGRQFRMRELFLAFFVVIYVIYVAIVYEFIDKLLFPDFLPWSTSFAALLSGNTTTWPLVIYFVAWDLTRVARGEEEEEEAAKRHSKALARQSQRPGALVPPSKIRGTKRVPLLDQDNGDSPNGDAEAPLLDFDAALAAARRKSARASTKTISEAFEADRVRAVRHRFLKELGNIALGFTILSLVFWLPTFLFQLILVKAAGITEFATLDSYGSYFSIAFYFFLIPAVRKLMAYQAKRRAAALEAQEAADAADSQSSA